MSQMNLDDSNHDRSALFAQINKGEDVTSGLLPCFFLEYSFDFLFDPLGLKKVTSEMQTHKNPSLRSGPAPFKAPSANGGSPAANKAPVVKPPIMVKEGKKWMVVSCNFVLSYKTTPK
jgi:adenylyl cyclase-associated protein